MTAQTIYLKDYRPPAYLVDSLVLQVDIFDHYTEVLATHTLRRASYTEEETPLILQGEALQTLSVSLDGKTLIHADYEISDHTLTLYAPPAAFVLETTVRILPQQNTTLSGFYQSQNGFFTQCEAEGFRRITWSLDRPDVMSIYTVTLSAAQKRFPVLLSNGNLIEKGVLENHRHFATWHDPFKKPSYLFAMAACDLSVLEDTWQTPSLRTVHLSLFADAEKLPACTHAMEALKRAMRWDEVRFGLACDVDHYMIVAVSDFNMGAMENKGLNIFNTKYVLASKETATDQDFENVERVVAHEYFHNWTGNRVTCRDWFALSLKEGLTVYRDQEFCRDTFDRDVARIQDVRLLRRVQFPEDAGPMSHPVRPSEYVEINNFYTVTVYEKGAEVVRMIARLLGKAGFRRGMNIYFARHDGQAVTCEDFVDAMKTAYLEQCATNHALCSDQTKSVDALFAQFMRWYTQAGTPKVTVRSHYDETQKRFTLSFTQSPLSGRWADKKPWVIPIALGLLSQAGEEIALPEAQKLFLLREETATLVFENIPEHPIPSLLRGFSAPVILEYPYSEADLLLLLAKDTDAFCQSEAATRLFSQLILAKADQKEAYFFPKALLTTAKALLLSDQKPALLAELFTLPDEATLAEAMRVVDPEALFAARIALARFLAEGLAPLWLVTYERFASQDDAGARAFKNLALAFLNEIPKQSYRDLAKAQFDTAKNMTDRQSALAILIHHADEETTKPLTQAALEAFYAFAKKDALVQDKWFALQAASSAKGTLATVKALTAHPDFSYQTPNRLYALLRTFSQNHRHFHEKEGSGYRFLSEAIAHIDTTNPQVAARLTRAFDRFARYDEARQTHAKAALTALQATKPSKDVAEILEKLLGKS